MLILDESPAEEMAAVRDLHIVTSPIGEIGLLVLECRLIPASIRYTEENNMAFCTMNRGIWPSVSEVLIDDEPPEIFEVVLDDTEATCYHDRNVVDIQLLVLLRYGDADRPVTLLVGICIVDTGIRRGVFERVGYFDLSCGKQNMESVLAAYDQGLVETILLV